MKLRELKKPATKRTSQISTERLIAKLTRPGSACFLTRFVPELSAFVMKVFETVSPGDVFLPNWHIGAMTYAAERVIEGKLKRLITTVPLATSSQLFSQWRCRPSYSVLIRPSGSYA